MKCKYCGSEVPEGTNFCPNCGKDLSKLKKCVKCGEIIDEDATFCPHCGAEQPVYQEDKKDNKKWIAIAVICIVAIAAIGSYFYINRRPGGDNAKIVSNDSVPQKPKTQPKEIKVRTLVMEEGQPPIIGGAIDKEFIKDIKLSGVAISSESSHLEVSVDMNFLQFDDSEGKPLEDIYFGGEPSPQWYTSVKHLSHGGIYYARAFVITNDNKIIYGSTKDVQVSDFIRSSEGFDYANVWNSNNCTLFDLETDEIIPSTYYYSTNERPDQLGQGQKGDNNTCYKFVDEYSYHHWRQKKDGILLDKPIIKYNNGKITIDSDNNVYYSINTHQNPSMFNQYTEPFNVSKGDAVFCYASDGSGHVSDIACYYIEK